MHIAFLSTLVSAGILCFLSVLFYIEKRRGTRFLSSLREAGDRGIAWLIRHMSRVSGFLERDVFRRTIHYVFHRVLEFMLSGLHVLEYYVGKLIHTNRTIAKKGAREPSGATTKLAEIAEHKVNTALSDEERREHKERSVGTRL